MSAMADSFRMKTRALILAIAVCVAAPVAASATRPSGLVYRYYPGIGYRLNPLLSFGNLNQAASLRDRTATRRLARQLLAHGTARGGALLWPYDFSFDGGPSLWTSGFTQIVAAQALLRAANLLGDPSLARAAAASFDGLRTGLLIAVPGGMWVREYSYTSQVILNAQLQSLLSLESYARLSGSPGAARLVARMKAATLHLLPQFDLGCWGRYELGGPAADTHYEQYHVELLGQITATHIEPLWRSTYERWRRCMP